MAMYLGSNKVEIGATSGSGGSSDFSTATVTFSTTVPNCYATIFGALYDISSVIEYPTPITAIGSADVEIENNDAYVVVLYNGITYVALTSDTITVSGNATAEKYLPAYGAWLVTVTGDCTITISS